MEQENHEQNPVAAPDAKKLVMRGAVSGVAGLVGLVIVGGIIFAYRAPDSTPVFPKVLTAIHAPAAIVGSDVITWKDIAIDTDALSKYLANPMAGGVSYSPDELRTRVLHRLMLTSASEQYAADNGVTVSEEALTKALDELAAGSGGKEQVEKDIKENFGWTYEQYRDRVVRSMLLLQELQTKLKNDASASEATKQKAEGVLAEIKAGKDFGELAKEYSDDSSAADGGELGFISKGVTVEPFETALFALKAGEVSGIVETEFGYHIIQAEELKKDAKGVVTEVRARHILFKHSSVMVEVQKYLDDASVWQFIKTEAPARQDPEAAV